MCEKVLIASDSTTDLNKELIDKYGIKILPLGVTLGDKVYSDGVDITPDEIYLHYEQNKELPKTSAVNVYSHSELFRKYTSEGYSVVYFTISSDMSATYNNAKTAAEEFENVFVVDTRNLSTGGGLLAVVAGEMMLAGKSAKEIAEVCKNLTSRVDASFIVDDLEFLHKGGRCSALAAFGANMLQLKPCITVKDGKMTVGKKYRGRFSAVLEKYIQDRIGDGSNVELEHVFITHAGCDEEIYQSCVEKVRSLAPFKNVYVTRAGCTISSHCGRNTLGVLFIRKGDV